MGDTIVVIQIGSSRAGFAYKQVNCNSITINKEWESCPIFKYKNRVSLLYRSDGSQLTVDSWGFNAIERSMNFRRKKQTNYHLIRKIPYKEADLNIENRNPLYITINENVQIPLEEFFYDFLTQMKQFIIKILANNNLFKSEQNIKWCIYRPISWADNISNKLLKAAYKLNLINQQFLTVINLINNPKLNNSNIILFDVGSNRVTGISRELNESIFNEGGHKFNTLFLEHLKKQYTRKVASGQPLEELAKKFFYDKFLDKIEDFKTTFFSPITSDIVLFEIPHNAAKFLGDEFGTAVLQLDLTTSCFTIPTNEIVKLFAQTIDPIVSFILEFIAKSSVNNSTRIVISGGFSQCFFLMAKLREEISSKTSILPENIIQDETFCLSECCTFASACNGTNFNLKNNDFVTSDFVPRRPPPPKPSSRSSTPVMPTRN